MISLQQSTPLFRTKLPFIGLALIYFAFLTRTYYWDGVLFSLYIEKVNRAELPSAILLHPNHLLYSVFGYFFYSLFHIANLKIRAITILQIMNVVASTSATMIVFSLAERLYQSRWLAIFSSLLFAFGATWWKFSTDANSYIISVLLLILSAKFLIGEKQSLWGATICHSFAMLFHQLAIFAYVPFLLAVFFNGKHWSARIWRVAGYAVSSIGFVSLTYYFAYHFVEQDNSHTFLQWVTSFSAESQVTHSWQQIFVTYPASYLKLLAGGKLTLVRDYLSLPVVIALSFCVICLVTGVWFLRHPFRQAENTFFMSRQTKIILWAWVLPYVFFLAWWEPGNSFYKLFIWPPIVLLLAGVVAERSNSTARIKAYIVFSVALMTWNFGAFIFPHAHSSADPVLAFAETVHREMPADAEVYYKVLSPDDWYIQYFAPGRRWLPLSAHTAEQSEAKIVCAETTALASFDMFTSPQQSWKLVNSKHNIQVACFGKKEKARRLGYEHPEHFPQ